VARNRTGGVPDRSVAFTTAIAGLATVMRREFRERLVTEDWVTRVGLRPNSYGVLTWIDRLEPVSQKQISDQIGLDPSDLVAVMDVLEQAGFVARQRDQDDRRRYSLTLTADGRRALRRLDVIAADAEDAALAPLDAAERVAFEGFVRRIIDHHSDHSARNASAGSVRAAT
jgi:MarR family transcriptional regulator, lower aerobic nicotinate degradation pathway regulator